jgi:hypothetical protein
MSGGPPPGGGPALSPTVRRPRLHWAWRAATAIVAVAGMVTVVAQLVERNSLPACDSDSARRTLTEVFREREIGAGAIDQIATVSSTDQEVSCRARVAATAGGYLAAEYRFIWNESTPQMRYTVRPMP